MTPCFVKITSHSHHLQKKKQLNTQNINNNMIYNIQDAAESKIIIIINTHYLTIMMVRVAIIKFFILKLTSNK